MAYSNITSLGQAVEAYHNDTLEKLYLFPLEFGGSNGPENILYVPKEVVVLKARYDAMVMELLKKGLVSSYFVQPEYKGDSFVPNSLTIESTGESEFKETIHIW